MDNGEVIPGLNEDWTFAGAKAMEWIAGGIATLVYAELFLVKPATAMPLLMAICIGTTLGLSMLRRQFPDEERGVRNFLMVLCGFRPPDIPSPSSLQPMWSGAPVPMLSERSKFERLGLGEMFPHSETADEEEKDAVQ